MIGSSLAIMNCRPAGGRTGDMSRVVVCQSTLGFFVTVCRSVAYPFVSSVHVAGQTGDESRIGGGELEIPQPLCPHATPKRQLQKARVTLTEGKQKKARTEP